MSGRSWEQLGADLAARLPHLDDGDVVILGSGRRYTQLLQRPDGLTVEAVSNSGLPPEQHLDAGRENLLREKGWQPPNGPLRRNWWHDTNQWPLHSRDAARIAELMTSTLREVYDVTEPADIEETSFNSIRTT